MRLLLLLLLGPAVLLLRRPQRRAAAAAAVGPPPRRPPRRGHHGGVLRLVLAAGTREGAVLRRRPRGCRDHAGAGRRLPVPGLPAGRHHHPFVGVKLSTAWRASAGTSARWCRRIPVRAAPGHRRPSRGRRRRRPGCPAAATARRLALPLCGRPADVAPCGAACPQRLRLLLLYGGLAAEVRGGERRGREGGLRAQLPQRQDLARGARRAKR